MQVKFQDCGCIALPGALIRELGLAGGALLEVEHVPGSHILTVKVPPFDPIADAFRFGAACPVGIESK